MEPRPLKLLYGATPQACLWSPITVITEMGDKDRCMLGIRLGVCQGRLCAYHVPGPGLDPRHHHSNNSIVGGGTHWLTTYSYIGISCSRLYQLQVEMRRLS